MAQTHLRPRRPTLDGRSFAESSFFSSSNEPNFQPMSCEPAGCGVLPTHDDEDFASRLPSLTSSSWVSLGRWARWRRASFHIRSSPSCYRLGAMIGARGLLNLLKFAIPIGLLLLWWGWHAFEPHLHVDLVFYDRTWITNEIELITPLSGCFSPDRVSPEYNLTQELYGKKRFEVQAGLPMRMGMDCYAFAGTVAIPEGHEAGQDTWIPPENRNQYHTYWRADLIPFGERQEHMIKSFFATQNLPHSRLVLWSNGDLSENPIVQKYLHRYPESFTLGLADIPSLAKGTAMDGHRLLHLNDQKAWLDGDLVRLLVIWHYGGMWIDMDMLLTRNLEPLLEHEFVTQWDCWGKTYQALNGALMHFKRHSPYLCEAFHLMATSSPPRSPSTDWGAILYLRLWRRLLASSIPPFKVLPFCFSDPLACRLDNSVPDPFLPDRTDGWWAGERGGLGEGGGLDRALKQIFAVHLHNRWNKPFPRGGWIERLLLRQYDETLATKQPTNRVVRNIP